MKTTAYQKSRSKESLNLVNTNSYKLNMLFDEIYGEGGEKEVSENELQEK